MSAALFFGSAAHVPGGQPLRAGPLRLWYEAGALRYLCVGPTEVVRMLYAAVRDERWGTVPARLEDERIETGPDWFRIRYVAQYREGPIHYTAGLELTGTAEGTVTVDFRGEARRTFRRNRIGLCVLHPLTEAGRALHVTHPDGRTSAGEFPRLVAPHQPLRDLRELAWVLDDGTPCTLTLAGETFETEDQRNWTDASFKTYGTPLALPFPVEVPAGERLHQRLTLRVRAVAPEVPPETDPVVRLRISAGCRPVPDLRHTVAACVAAFAPAENFAELNRNRPAADDPRPFVSFAIDPQVHLIDTRTLLENAAAQRDALETARHFAGGRAVHVGPVALPARNRPGVPEPRENSLFGLVWTVLSLRYLAGADSVTFDERALPTRWLRYLLGAFGATGILPSESPEPLAVDALVLENARGERLALMANLTAVPRRVEVPGWGRPSRQTRWTGADWQAWCENPDGPGWQTEPVEEGVPPYSLVGWWWA
jgi:hypothetical protein